MRRVAIPILALLAALTSVGARQVALNGHTNDVTFVAFLADGKTLMSGSEDSTIRLWDTSEGRERSVWQKTSEFDAAAPSTSVLALSGDGLVLARAGGPQGTAELWNAAQITRIRSIKAHQRPVIGVALSRNAGTLATFSQEEVRTWDGASGRPWASLKAPNLYAVLAVAVSTDGKLVAVATSDKQVGIFEATKGSVVAQFDGGPGQLHALAFSPDGQFLAVGRDGGEASGENSSLAIWDVGKKALLDGVTGPGRFAKSVAFSADSRLLASAGLSVKIWDLEARKVTQTFPGHEGPIRSMAFSPDGHLLATASEDNLVGLWKLGDR